MEKRELKFRAYHKTRKELYDVYGFNKEFVFKYTLDGVGFDGNPDKIEDVVLMQYTGLKDKKGVEICEGDIVQFKRIKSKGFHCAGGSYERQESDIFTAKVTYSDGAFSLFDYGCYPFDVYLCQWQHTFIHGESRLSNLSVNRKRIGGNDQSIYVDIEVIGNQFESPELLNQD